MSIVKVFRWPFVNAIEKKVITDRAIKSVKWSGLGGLLPRLITPISTLILATLLSPADFGIVAVCMAVINFAQIIVEMGIGKAIIQRQVDVSAAASIAFILNMALAVTMCSVVWLLAPLLESAYGIPELTSPLRFVSFALVLSGLISIPTALLTREMSFRRLFFVAALPQIVNACISVSIAIYRADYWALLIGYLSGNIVHAIAIWVACPWRPKLIMNIELTRSIMQFSSWILISNLLTWLFLYADNLLVGYFLGADALGVYSLGFNLSNLVPGMVVSTLAAVAYPAFSALQINTADVGESLMKLHALVAAVIFPIAFGFSAVASEVVHLLYGEKWPGLPMVILFMSIMPGLSHLWSLNADAFRAVGRPDIWMKAAALTLVVLMPLLIVIGEQKDLYVFVLARFLGAFLLPLFNILYTRTILGISLSQQWLSFKTPLLSASIMYLLVIFTSQYLRQFSSSSDLMNLLILVAVGVFSYVAVLRIVAPSLWVNLWLLAGKATEVS